MESQSGDDDFNINACFDDKSIIDRILNDKKDIRVRVKTMAVIENLQVINAAFPEYSLSRIPER